MTREKSGMASVNRPMMVSVMPRSPYASISSGLALIAAFEIFERERETDSSAGTPQPRA